MSGCGFNKSTSTAAIMISKPWVDAARQVQFSTWRGALVVAGGNITRASEALNIGRATGTRLTRKFDLREFAAGLRLENGAARSVGAEREGIVTGRPRKR